MLDSTVSSRGSNGEILEPLDFLTLPGGQSKTVRIFERLRKRGTTAHFKAHIAPSVRGNGHPVRMRIGHSTLQTTQKIVAVPEQSLNAARTLEMTNSTGQSLLPGKVALYQDGAFPGMTEIDFIAMGERFALFLSVADHIKELVLETRRRLASPAVRVRRFRRRTPVKRRKYGIGKQLLDLEDLL